MHGRGAHGSVRFGSTTEPEPEPKLIGSVVLEPEPEPKKVGSVRNRTIGSRFGSGRFMVLVLGSGLRFWFVVFVNVLGSQVGSRVG